MRIFEIEPGQKRQVANIKDNLEKVWNRLIEPNCSNVLEVYRQQQQVLYRGTKSQNKEVYRGSSQQERRPKDSISELSTLFDKMLAANGMTALRSNSFFATSVERHAAGFGKVYFVFPSSHFIFSLLG